MKLIALFMAMLSVGVLLRGDVGSSIVANGSFRDWQDTAVAEWRVVRAAIALDTEMSYSSRGALRMTLQEGGPSLLLQDVDLEPDTDYVLGLNLAKDGNGVVQIRVQPIVNGALLPAAESPLNWSNIWSTGFPWTPVKLNFRTQGHTRYRLTVVQSGRVGESMWLEDVSIRKAETAEQLRPGGVYSQSIMLPFHAQQPLEGARDVEELLVSGIAGEYAAVKLGVTAPQDLKKVDLRLKEDLLLLGNDRIPADQVVVRMVADQALLPLSKPRDAKAGENVGWWVTVRVPEQTVAGVYRGELQLLLGDKVARTIPLAVRVEQFTLPAPAIPMFVYHNERYFPSGFLSAEMRQAYYDDMREHGMNTVTVYNTPDVDGKRIDFDRDYTWEINQERIDEMNKRGYSLTAQEVEERFQFGLNQVLPMIEKSGLTRAGHPVLWLTHKMGRYAWGDMPTPVLQESVDKWLANKGWPKPLLYVIDEPEGHPDRIAAARRALDRINSLNLPVQKVTANVAVKELGADYDVWIQLEKRITSEMVLKAKEYDADLWVYNCNMHTENAALTRVLFGFWAYRSGINGVGLWAYYDAMNWYADADGQVHGENGRFGFARICPSPHGPIPTISWETTREGVNDYRYAMLFDQYKDELKQRQAALAEFASSGLSGAEREKALAESDWLPEDTSKHGAVQAWRKANELGKLHAVVVRARALLIESIPLDAMSTMGAHPFAALIRDWVPVTGVGDPRLTPENQRNNLRAYVRRMQAALAESDVILGGK